MVLKLVLLAIIFSFAIVFTSSGSVFANTIQENSTAQANAYAYNSMQYKIHSMINANKMNSQQELNLQKFIETERSANHALAVQYLSSTQKEQLAYKSIMGNMSKAMAYHDVSQRDWYITKTHMDNQDIFKMMKNLKQQRINIDDIGKIKDTVSSYGNANNVSIKLSESLVLNKTSTNSTKN